MRAARGLAEVAPCLFGHSRLLPSSSLLPRTGMSWQKHSAEEIPETFLTYWMSEIFVRSESTCQHLFTLARSTVTFLPRFLRAHQRPIESITRTKGTRSAFLTPGQWVLTLTQHWLVLLCPGSSQNPPTMEWSPRLHACSKLLAGWKNAPEWIHESNSCKSHWNVISIPK